jgi:hypothetical protein
MEGTYWCRWNGKSWEPFWLQPLTQGGGFEETQNDTDAIGELGAEWEYKGFHDGYLAGCLDATSNGDGANRVIPLQQNKAESSYESALWRNSPSPNNTKVEVNQDKARRTERKPKSKRKDKAKQSSVTKKPSREDIATRDDKQHTDQEILELEAAMDAKFVKVLREKNPPLWPILGLNLAYKESE